MPPAREAGTSRAGPAASRSLAPGAPRAARLDQHATVQHPELDAPVERPRRVVLGRRDRRGVAVALGRELLELDRWVLLHQVRTYRLGSRLAQLHVRRRLAHVVGVA